MKLYATLEQQLKKENNFVTDSGDLKKWVVLNKAQNFDEELIELLLDNKDLKEKFFINVKGVLVFNQYIFMQFLEQKNYLNDSYTQYKNKVGLTIDGKYLKQRNEVALVWPFKDCILEGGQSREEDKREEIFFNEILAQDEITQLLEPKVLTNAKRIDKDGEKPFDQFNRNGQGVITDNMIIKGNNLLALHTLKKEFAGKVKLIYIDPPYNTGNDGFKYNDNFNHSTWLTFMKNRLEIARELLREDGVIMVQCDDNEQAYLKVLMDSVFGRGNFVNNIIWHKKNVVQNDTKYFNENHDFIVLYARKKNIWRPNLLARTEEMNARYDNPDNDPRGKWTSVALQAKSGSDNNIYEVEFDNGVKWKPVNGTFPRLSKESLLKAYQEERLWFGKDGKNVPRLKKYLSEVKQGLVPNTIFVNGETGSTQLGKEDLKKLFSSNPFSTPKPELLIKRIIDISTKESDIVLDYHLGSGTTAAVAHKMNRQYIGIEQMDYIESVTIERLKKVIEGEQGGISKSINWQGGGEFIYLELKKYNQAFIEQIEEAKDTDALLQIWEQMKDKSFLNYNVDIKKQDEHLKEFKALNFAEQKQHLCEILDKNQLYVNRSSLNDTDFACTEEEKKVTKDFYQIRK